MASSDRVSMVKRHHSITGEPSNQKRRKPAQNDDETPRTLVKHTLELLSVSESPAPWQSENIAEIEDPTPSTTVQSSETTPHTLVKNALELMSVSATPAPWEDEKLAKPANLDKKPNQDDETEDDQRKESPTISTEPSGHSMEIDEVFIETESLEKIRKSESLASALVSLSLVEPSSMKTSIKETSVSYCKNPEQHNVNSTADGLKSISSAKVSFENESSSEKDIGTKSSSMPSEDRMFSFQISEKEDEENMNISHRKKKTFRTVRFDESVTDNEFSNKDSIQCNTPNSTKKVSIRKTPTKVGKSSIPKAAVSKTALTPTKPKTPSIGNNKTPVTPTKLKAGLPSSNLMMTGRTPTKSSTSGAQTPPKELSSAAEENPSAGLLRTPGSRRVVIPPNLVLTPGRVPLTPAQLAESAKSRGLPTPQRNIGPPRRVKTPLKVDPTPEKPSSLILTPARRVPSSQSISEKKIKQQNSIPTPKRVLVNKTTNSPTASPKMRLVNSIKEKIVEDEKDSSEEETIERKDKKETMEMEESSDEEFVERFNFKTFPENDVVAASVQTNQVTELEANSDPMAEDQPMENKGKQLKLSRPCNVLRKKVPVKPPGAPTLPLSFIRKEFKRFSSCRVSKDLDEVLIKCTNEFFKTVCCELQESASKAKKKTIAKDDVVNLMKRQGLVTEEKPLNTLIAEYLPLEMRAELIPMARANNKIVPSRRN